MSKQKRSGPVISKNKIDYNRGDQKLLKAIKEHGSINKAAEKLNRSYSHSQKRIREIEKEFGKLIDSKRGGSRGGGSKLTQNADELIQRYEKLRTEYQRINEINITTLKGKIRNKKKTICTVETPIGKIKSVLTNKVDENDEVNILIREDAVTIRKSDKTDPKETSARNRFIGKIKEISPYQGIVKLKIDIEGNEITTTITKESKQKMDLSINDKVNISFKATATKTIKPT